MRKLWLVGALALALGGGGGCSTFLSQDKGFLTQTLADEKAEFAVEAALYGANSAAKAALDSGLLTAGSPQSIKVADGLFYAHTAVIAARNAYKLGDAKTTAEKVAAASSTIGAAWALIPKKEGQ